MPLPKVWLSKTLARRPPVHGSVRLLEHYTRRSSVPKIVRFQAALAQRRPATGGVGPSEDLPNTCPNHPRMFRAPAHGHPVSVRPADHPEERSALVPVPEGPVTQIAPGKPVCDLPNQPPVGVWTEGEVPARRPVLPVPLLASRWHASTPSDANRGTFAAQSGDRPAGPMARKPPTPESCAPTAARP